MLLFVVHFCGFIRLSWMQIEEKRPPWELCQVFYYLCRQSCFQIRMRPLRPLPLENSGWKIPKAKGLAPSNHPFPTGIFSSDACLAIDHGWMALKYIIWWKSLSARVKGHFYLKTGWLANRSTWSKSSVELWVWLTKAVSMIRPLLWLRPSRPRKNRFIILISQ